MLTQDIYDVDEEIGQRNEEIQAEHERNREHTLKSILKEGEEYDCYHNIVDSSDSPTLREISIFWWNVHSILHIIDQMKSL